MKSSIIQLWNNYHSTFEEITEIHQEFDREDSDTQVKQQQIRKLFFLHIRLRNIMRAIAHEKRRANG